jgi:hypothetical protein
MKKEAMADLEAQMMVDTLWLRAEFFRRISCLTDPELAILLAKPGADSSLHMSQWHAEGRIFLVTRDSAAFYPAFQFGPDLHPQLIVGEILTILRQAPPRSNWDNALWFIAANGWLAGQSPLDLIFTEPALVKDAAEQEVLPDTE